MVFCMAKEQCPLKTRVLPSWTLRCVGDSVGGCDSDIVRAWKLLVTPKYDSPYSLRAISSPTGPTLPACSTRLGPSDLCGGLGVVGSQSCHTRFATLQDECVGEWQPSGQQPGAEAGSRAAGKRTRDRETGRRVGNGEWREAEGPRAVAGVVWWWRRVMATGSEIPCSLQGSMTAAFPAVQAGSGSVVPGRKRVGAQCLHPCRVRASEHPESPQV